MKKENLKPNGLIAFRKKHNLSQKELAEILGVTFQAIILWETDQRSISLMVTRIISMFIKFPQLLKEFGQE